MSKLNNMGIFCAKNPIQSILFQTRFFLLRFAKKAQKRLEFGSKPKTKHIVDWIMAAKFSKAHQNSQDLSSAYHVLNKEIQGCETQNTFYLYRHQNRSFHIDYFFCPTTILQSFEIKPYEKWINYRTIFQSW